MKKKFIFTSFLILFSIFCFFSCVDKVVDDETALTAFLESYAKIMQKDGYVMEGNFDFNFCIDEIDIACDGTINAESTISPNIASKVEMDVGLNVMGFKMTTPITYYAIFDKTANIYMCALGEWTGESIEIEGNVFEKYLETVKELRTKESLLKLNNVMRKGCSAKFNGITTINDISVYDIDIICNENLLSEMINFLKDYPIYEIPLHKEPGPTGVGATIYLDSVSDEEIKEISQILKDFSFKVYLKEKNCSFYGMEIDFKSFLDTFFANASSMLNEEVTSSSLGLPDIDGSMQLFYLDKKPKTPITLPKEAIESAE